MSCLFSCCTSNPADEPSRLAPQAPVMREYNSCCDRILQALGGCGLSTVSVITGIVGTVFGCSGGVGVVVTYSAFSAGLISTGFIGLAITLVLFLIAAAFFVLSSLVCDCAEDYVVKSGEQIAREQAASANRQAIRETHSDQGQNKLL